MKKIKYFLLTPLVLLTMEVHVHANTAASGRETDVESPTEGVITHQFVPETEMMQDLLQMLTDHLVYMKSLYTPCVSPTSQGEDCGFFKDTERMPTSP